MKKILAAAIATTCLSAHAEPPYREGGIKVGGSWFDPTRAGQGVILEEIEQPGASGGETTLLAYFFTYDDNGNPTFVVGQGPFSGGQAELEAVKPTGGQLGVELDPNQIVNEPWGTISIDVHDCTSLDFSYETADGTRSGVLPMVPVANEVGFERVYDACAASTGEKIPVSDPTVELEACSSGIFGSCNTRTLPYSTSASVSTTVVGSRPARYEIGKFTIRPTDAVITITNVRVSDSNTSTGASIDGLLNAMQIHPGEEVTFRLLSDWTGGATEQLTYSFDIDGIGRVFEYAIQLRTN